MSATAIRKSPLLLKFLAEDFSLLIIKRPRVWWQNWRRPYYVLH